MGAQSPEVRVSSSSWGEKEPSTGGMGVSLVPGGYWGDMEGREEVPRQVQVKELEHASLQPSLWVARVDFRKAGGSI